MAANPEAGKQMAQRVEEKYQGQLSSARDEATRKANEFKGEAESKVFGAAGGTPTEGMLLAGVEGQEASAQAAANAPAYNAADINNRWGAAAEQMRLNREGIAKNIQNVGTMAGRQAEIQSVGARPMGKGTALDAFFMGKAWNPNQLNQQVAANEQQLNQLSGEVGSTVTNAAAESSRRQEAFRKMYEGVKQQRRDAAAQVAKAEQDRLDAEYAAQQAAIPVVTPTPEAEPAPIFGYKSGSMPRESNEDKRRMEDVVLDPFKISEQLRTPAKRLTKWLQGRG
jgi:hypothetical protein